MQALPSSPDAAVAGENRALRWFALATALATFVLVWAGGLVTSKGVGLSVPDWPNSYGYNMFFFPISKWMGGIRFEHIHRLIASGVGMMTTVLALWLYGRNARPVMRWGGRILLVGGIAAAALGWGRWQDNFVTITTGVVALLASYAWPNCDPAPRWLRRLGLIAFFAVVLQGILGGLRVTTMKDQLGIFHATLAQLFFLLVSALALFQTKFWRNLPFQTAADQHCLRPLFTFASTLILVQLILGATMRHQHAGLAIPDFPAAYHKIWPDTDAASIVKYNQMRLDSESYNPITAFQVILQMAHRIMALCVCAAVAAAAWRARRRLGAAHLLSKLTLGWFCLIVAQIFLGATTIWTGKSADIATAHVACGALSLMSGGLISILTYRLFASASSAVPAPAKNNLTSLLPSSSISR